MNKYQILEFATYFYNIGYDQEGLTNEKIFAKLAEIPAQPEDDELKELEKELHEANLREAKDYSKLLEENNTLRVQNIRLINQLAQRGEQVERVSIPQRIKEMQKVIASERNIPVKAVYQEELEDARLLLGIAQPDSKDTK